VFCYSMVPLISSPISWTSSVTPRLIALCFRRAQRLACSPSSLVQRCQFTSLRTQTWASEHDTWSGTNIFKIFYPFEQNIKKYFLTHRTKSLLLQKNFFHVSMDEWYLWL
jgi:hypothetical protein